MSVSFYFYHDRVGTQLDLPVNHSKTLVLHLGKFERVNYCIDNIPLRVSGARDLGVYVNKNLKIYSYVKHIVHETFAVFFTMIRNV